MLLMPAWSLVGGDRAAAESSDQLRTRAKRIAAEQARLEQAAEALNEKTKRSEELAASLDKQIVAARQTLERQQGGIADLQRRLADLALSSYANGHLAAGLDSLVSGSATDVGLRRGYAPVVLGDQTDLLDTVRAAGADTAATARSLERALGEQRALAATIATQRAELRAAGARLDASAIEVQGDLARAVAAERAAILAAEEQRAADRLRARQDADAHRTTPTTRTSTSASTGTRRPSTTPSGPSRTSPAAPAPTVPVGLPPAPSPAAGVAVGEALRQLGRPYVFGTNGPDTFDCSGLTQWAWAKAGVAMPHYTVSQFRAFPRVALDQLQPGDLVFFNVDLGHMGMYIGNGQLVQAPRTGEVVKITPVNARTVVGAVRPG